jgi:GGDEF domain-containing protein
VSGLLVLVGALASALRDHPRFDAPYGYVVLLLVIAELRPLARADRRDPGGLTLSEAFVFALVMHWGLSLALLALVGSMTVADAVRGRKPWRTAFNIAQYSLAYAAATLVLMASSVNITDHGGTSLGAHDLPAILAAGITFFVVNDLLVAGAVARHERLSYRAVLLDAPAYRIISTTALLCLAPLLVVVAERSSGFLPLLLVPLYAVGQAAARAEERERQALHDPLTGLANRTQLLERARPALAAAGGDAPPVALLMIDLDGFKAINDTHGHLAGDELLRLVGARLTGAVRPDDMVARFGGDEFAVLLSDLSAESVADWPGLLSDRAQAPVMTARGAWPVSPEEVADHVATRIRHALGEPYQIDGMTVTIGASVGAAVAPSEGADIDALLHAADVAMYAVKAARRPAPVDALPPAAADTAQPETTAPPAAPDPKPDEITAGEPTAGDVTPVRPARAAEPGRVVVQERRVARQNPIPRPVQHQSATASFLAEHGFALGDPVGASNGKSSSGRG